MDYNSKLGITITECKVCTRIKECCQHHIEPGNGRKTSKVIWVCVICHDKIHNNTSWAYENGYLSRHNKSYKITMKTKTDKKCSHGKSYYDHRLGYIKCQFCGQKVESINFGTTKAPKAVKAPKIAIKMSEEIQDPRNKKAEELKRQLQSVTIAIKKNASDITEYTKLVKKKIEIKADIQKLKASYED